MPFELMPIEPADGLEWCEVHYSAFSPWLGCLWRHAPTKENNKEMAKNRIAGLADPNTHAIKVVDIDTGKIAGVAKWMIYEHERTPEELEKSFEEAPWTDDINPQARRAFIKNLHNCRRNILGTQPAVVLGALVVRPEYQRQGVGHMLVEWGTTQADKCVASSWFYLRVVVDNHRLGLVGYLESSKNGTVLYQRCGYEPHSEIYFDTTLYGGSGIDTHTIMFRQPKPVP